jgi:hypothetical protein
LSDFAPATGGEHGANQPELAKALPQFAEVYRVTHAFDKAEALYQRALSISEHSASADSTSDFYRQTLLRFK